MRRRNIAALVAIATTISVAAQTRVPAILETDPDPIHIDRFTDDGLKHNLRPEFAPESDRILNVNEIEPGPQVLRLFQRPFEYLTAFLPSQIEANASFTTVDDVASLFELAIGTEQRERIVRITPNRRFAIRGSDFVLHLYRSANNEVGLFAIEYEPSSRDFGFAIDLEVTKNEFAAEYGVPTFESHDGSVTTYVSFKSLRQVSFYWEQDRIIGVQMVAWYGV